MTQRMKPYRKIIIFKKLLKLRNLMLEIDDSQEFVWEIIDEVFDSTIKVIYDKYLEKQAIPYTISKAHEAILHIIDVINDK